MFMVFGETDFGKVDRVPGVCYVITRFFHINHMPIVPSRSFVVVEGTENGGSFRGRTIPMNSRSVLVAYVRNWVGLLALIGAIASGIVAYMTGTELGLPPSARVALSAIGLSGVPVLFVSGTRGAWLHAVASAAGAIMWLVLTDFSGGAVFGANPALVLCGLTRLWDRAGPARSRELLEKLGIEVPDDGDEDDARRTVLEPDEDQRDDPRQWN